MYYQHFQAFDFNVGSPFTQIRLVDKDTGEELSYNLDFRLGEDEKTGASSLVKEVPTLKDGQQPLPGMHVKTGHHTECLILYMSKLVQNFKIE